MKVKSPNCNKVFLLWKRYQGNSYHQATFAFEMHASMLALCQSVKESKVSIGVTFMAQKGMLEKDSISAVQTAHTSLQHQGDSCHMLIYDNLRQCHQVFSPHKTLRASKV